MNPKTPQPSFGSHHSPHASLPHSATYRGARLRDLPPEQRPRERLLREGVARLDHASLLSLLLGTGRSADEDALMLARRMINAFGSLRALTHADSDTLSQIRGVGPAKATRLLAAFELARRALESEHNAQELDEESASVMVSVSATLIALARARWDGEGALMIACPVPDEFTMYAFNDAIDAAVTLSLAGDLSDSASYGRWFARLLREDSEHAWCLISLRPVDELTTHERESLPRLRECAALLHVPLCYLLVASSDHDWTLLEPELIEAFGD